ncbi:MAG TPA: hypothetical protein ENN09_03815 [Planctomycetes bacterium]|nr:hypothetical protein [Planctomycetota bacterium]
MFGKYIALEEVKARDEQPPPGEPWTVSTGKYTLFDMDDGKRLDWITDSGTVVLEVTDTEILHRRHTTLYRSAIQGKKIMEPEEIAVGKMLLNIHLAFRIAD